MEAYGNPFMTNGDTLEVCEEEEFHSDQEGSKNTYEGKHPDSEGEALTLPKEISCYPCSSLVLYSREVGEVRLLSPEQEYDLARKIAEGNKRIQTLLLQSPVGLEWIGRVVNQMERGEICPKDILEISTHSSRRGQKDDLALRGRYLSFVRQLRKLYLDSHDLQGRVNHMVEPGSAGIGKTFQSQISIERLSDQIPIKRQVLEDLEVGLGERIHFLKGHGGFSRATVLRERMERILSEVERSQQEVRKARDDFVRANLRLVITIANNYVNRGLLLCDLIQEGNIGLMKAVDKFDYRKGYKFSTHASWWIMQTITRAIANQGRLIRIPAHVMEDQTKMTRAFSKLFNQAGREPTSSQVTEATGISLGKVNRILHISIGEPISLDRPAGDNGVPFGELMADEKSVSPLEMANRTDLGLALERVLTSLGPREAKVVRMRFGIREKRQYTLGELGRKFGISSERVRQIQNRALGKLKRPERKHRLMTLYE